MKDYNTRLNQTIISSKGLKQNKWMFNQIVIKSIKIKHNYNHNMRKKKIACSSQVDRHHSNNIINLVKINKLSLILKPLRRKKVIINSQLKLIMLNKIYYCQVKYTKFKISNCFTEILLRIIIINKSNNSKMKLISYKDSLPKLI